MSSIVAVSSLIFGKEIVVQTISSTSSSIISTIKTISDNYDNETKELFNRLDIKFKLEIITKYIESIEFNKHLDNKSIDLCVEYIKEILIMIENEVNTLEKEIEIYKNRWVKNLSSGSFKTQFTNIESHVNILEQRFNTLIKILKN